MRSRRQPQVKLPTQPIPATINKLSHDGRGIGKLEGKTVFISNALPGEEVLFTYTQQHSRFDEGKAIKISKASVERTQPLCPHFGFCGGCSLQHLSPQAQLAHKQQMLLEQLQHFGKVAPEQILEPITAEPWGYRSKARLGVLYDVKTKNLILGYRQEQSNKLTNIQSCVILDKRIGLQIHSLRACLLQLKSLAAISHIEIIGTDQTLALVFRHTQPLLAEDKDALTLYGNTQNFIIFLQPGEPTSLIQLYPEKEPVNLTYQLPAFRLEYRFHAQDFTQINPLVNQKMVSLALELLRPEPQDTILDLFCGLGNFTLPVAQQAGLVLGVEGDAQMVARATHNATLNNITNAQFYKADLTQDWTKATWFNPKINKVLLDPPRNGAQEIIKQMRKHKLERIVYVSCNPATLARDAGILVHEQGYRFKQLAVLDMFPQTSHIEAIALFSK